MPPAFAFDTLKAADTLIAAGITPAHARAITETMNDAVTEGVATKADIAKLEAGIAELRAEVKADTAEVKADTARLETGLAELKADVRADIGNLESRLSARIDTEVGALNSRLNMLQWGLGLIAAVVLLMAGRMFGVY